MAEAKEVQTQSKGGRPKGSKTRVKRSGLRPLYERMNRMVSEKALAIIQSSLDEKDAVDKDSLATAKFCITTVKSLHQACLQEEQNWVNAQKRESGDAVDDDDEEDTGRAGFSLYMIDGNKKTEIV